MCDSSNCLWGLIFLYPYLLIFGKIKKLERKICLIEYFATKLPQVFRSINNRPVDTYSSTFFWTIPEIPIKRVKCSSGQVKWTNRCIDNSNNHANKHHKPAQTGVMPLSGLAFERSRASRDRINWNRTTSIHNLNRSKDKIKNLYYSIHAEQLNQN